MVEYNIVKFCRICRKRYVVNRTLSSKNLCDDCQKAADNESDKYTEE